MCQWAERPFVMRGELALRHVTRSDPDAIALVACGLVRHQQAYVVDGFRQRASTRFIETYEQLERELPALQRCDAFVLAIQDGRGRSPLEIVKALTREWPRAAIVIFCPPRAERPMWMPQLTLAGARGFVFEGVNDTSATLAQVVENARNECVGLRIVHVPGINQDCEIWPVSNVIDFVDPVVSSLAIAAEQSGGYLPTSQEADKSDSILAELPLRCLRANKCQCSLGILQRPAVGVIVV